MRTALPYSNTERHRHVFFFFACFNTWYGKCNFFCILILTPLNLRCCFFSDEGRLLLQLCVYISAVRVLESYIINNIVEKEDKAVPTIFKEIIRG